MLKYFLNKIAQFCLLKTVLREFPKISPNSLKSAFRFPRKHLGGVGRSARRRPRWHSRSLRASITEVRRRFHIQVSARMLPFRLHRRFLLPWPQIWGLDRAFGKTRVAPTCFRLPQRRPEVRCLSTPMHICRGRGISLIFQGLLEIFGAIIPFMAILPSLGR